MRQQQEHSREGAEREGRYAGGGATGRRLGVSAPISAVTDSNNMRTLGAPLLFQTQPLSVRSTINIPMQQRSQTVTQGIINEAAIEQTLPNQAPYRVTAYLLLPFRASPCCPTRGGATRGCLSADWPGAMQEPPGRGPAEVHQWQAWLVRGCACRFHGSRLHLSSRLTKDSLRTCKGCKCVAAPSPNPGMMRLSLAAGPLTRPVDPWKQRCTLYIVYTLRVDWSMSNTRLALLLRVIVILS